ncbi:GNAT family N-acetyltransferase [Chitinimonas arctica]|uniref:GNAT family N-acetyltransferase n=1 Tax=Chitinimonas arctica TaxID=2594795 RepID=A0A516SEJ3_9NEIS|nr:GNAT family N-acetyltransferase [Chitinimonas arctica]QDQ26576.1 GNAT family N-acetyltransferase [Chitinimonas arctica]
MVDHSPNDSHLWFGPIDMPALAVLQPHYQTVRPGVPPLSQELTDFARGHGQHVMVAWRADVPVACLGWVSEEVAHSGRLYGAPLLATDGEAAAGLIVQLRQIAQHLNARQIRISAWAGERDKAVALVAAGFEPLFEWVNFAIDTAGAQSPDLRANRWQLVAQDQLDWTQLAALYNATFRHVPNSPPRDALNIADDWARADGLASCVFADADGHYRGFALIEEGHVNAVGVDDALRGSGLAELIYQYARANLAQRGMDRLKALVSSANPASMRFHQKLGFIEDLPRGTVYELTL